MASQPLPPSQTPPQTVPTKNPSFLRTWGPRLCLITLLSPLWLSLILIWFLISLPRVAVTIESAIIFAIWFSKTIGAGTLSSEVLDYTFGTSAFDVICLTSFRFLFLFLFAFCPPTSRYPSRFRRQLAFLWTILCSVFLITKLTYLQEGWRVGVTVVSLIGSLTSFANENWLMTSWEDLILAEDILLDSVGIKVTHSIGNARQSSSPPKRTGYNKLEEESHPPHSPTVVTPLKSVQKPPMSSNGVHPIVLPQMTLHRRFVGGLSYFESETETDQEEKQESKEKEDQENGTRNRKGVSTSSRSLVKKPPLVLCHGYGAGKAVWATVITGLSAKFHLYILDAHGIGMSSRPRWKARRTSQAELFFVDQMERWRAEIGLTNFILMGHSLGGYLAGVYALKYPTHVKQLILASPVAVPEYKIDEPPTPKTNEAKRRAARRSGWVFAIFRLLWSSGITPPALLRFFGPFSLLLARYIIRRRMVNVRALNVDRLADYLYHLNLGPASGEKALPIILAPGAWAKRALGPRLGGLTVPVGFIYGESDWMDQDAGEKVLAELYGAEEVYKYLRVVPNAGHQLTLENPTSFVQATEELIESLDNSTTKSIVIHMEQSAPDIV